RRGVVFQQVLDRLRAGPLAAAARLQAEDVALVVRVIIIDRGAAERGPGAVAPRGERSCLVEVERQASADRLRLLPRFAGDAAGPDPLLLQQPQQAEGEEPLGAR